MECKIIHNFQVSYSRDANIGVEMVNGPKPAVSSPFFRLPSPPSPANIPLTLAYLFIVVLFASTYVTAIKDVTTTPCCDVNGTLSFQRKFDVIITSLRYCIDVIRNLVNTTKAFNVTMSVT